MIYDFAVIGGGIIGLATAWQLSLKRAGAAVVVLEKEQEWARHQSGRNSGVIHSGLYYRPGSLKARMAVAGNRTMIDFCREHSIPHRVCGKLVVAVDETEVAALKRLQENSEANGVSVRSLRSEEAREIEPHVRCVGALHVPSTGTVDYRQVALKIRALLDRKADLVLGETVRAFREKGEVVHVVTKKDEFRARVVINTGGLFSDRLARAAGETPAVQIVPFRGEYYSVGGASADLIRTLIYPVPDPSFPFLGVHITRGIDDHVHAGPNAVPALRREGYSWRSFSPRDSFETLTFPGFWRLALRHWDEGMREIARSLSKRRFTDSVRRLVPEIREADLLAAPAGVRAQALTSSGHLADDFVIVRGRRTIHVCNAPSPGATASLVIGEEIASMAVSHEAAPARA